MKIIIDEFTIEITATDSGESFIDKLSTLLSLPSVQAICAQLTNIANIHANKAVTDQANINVNLTQNDKDLLRITLTDFIESDTEINEDNETLLKLQESYPEVFEKIIPMLNQFNFDQTLSYLMFVLPANNNPIRNWIDIDATNKEGKYIANADNPKPFERLNELYEYLKTVT